ncbi:MAG: ThiF family adenylyltransferase, partial [Alistipes sp.]|nr:ThiF family adenylyltransferase [Alistipes sp.]
MNNWLERTELLFGYEKLELLRQANVLVVGVGGVGAYAAEMIVRAGVGRMTIADADRVSESNINRQLVALHSTIGQKKCEVLAQRLRDINPELQLTLVNRFIKDDETDALLDSDKFDYVVDAIDTLSPKLALIKGSLDRGIPVVSSMGAGAKTDPTLMEIK